MAKTSDTETVQPAETATPDRILIYRVLVDGFNAHGIRAAKGAKIRLRESRGKVQEERKALAFVEAATEETPA